VTGLRSAGAAIRGWEAILGRPAPDPAQPGRGGRPRMNPELPLAGPRPGGGPERVRPTVAFTMGSGERWAADPKAGTGQAQATRRELTTST
jgi:hypothetical protein